MKQAMLRKVLLLIMIPIAMVLVSCTTTQGEVDASHSYSWWIPKTDGMGVFYQDYEENPGVQWLNNQYWNNETGTYSTDGTGTKLKLSFQAPITGSEADNFNTMIATGSYPDIIDLSFAVDSPKQMFEDGVLIELTEYVEAYMPDYLAFIDLHPEIKPFVSHKDDEGKDHYYALWGFNNTPRPQWEGYVYRRDWVVKYAEPTPYVWDWESDFVSTNGRPKYTPLSVAESNADYTGWKINPVTAFTSNFGDDITWEDNVIFPSGTDTPLYISDWEWMFEAFALAIEAEGFGDNTNAYCVSIPYQGYHEAGDLVSSFGGGGPMWSIDGNGDAVFGGTGSNFKTYVEAMNSWYENGWMDTKFETRSSDMFWKINLTGSSQGMVGLFQSGSAYLGTVIRTTATNVDAQQDAMVFGTPLPINDVYGGESNRFVEPDTYYSANLLNPPTGFTPAIEGKDLETLFTMLNWLYTFEGAMFSTLGLSEEMYDTGVLDPDLYAEYGIDAGYYVEEDSQGKTVYVANVSTDKDLSNAIRAMRMDTHLTLYSLGDLTIDEGYSPIVAKAKQLWSMYDCPGYILDYAELFDEDQSEMYAKARAYINTSMSMEIPVLIKNGLDNWDVYVSKVSKYGPGRVTTIFQELLDSIDGD